MAQRSNHCRAQVRDRQRALRQNTNPRTVLMAGEEVLDGRTDVRAGGQVGGAHLLVRERAVQ